MATRRRRPVSASCWPARRPSPRATPRWRRSLTGRSVRCSRSKAPAPPWWTWGSGGGGDEAVVRLSRFTTRLPSARPPHETHGHPVERTINTIRSMLDVIFAPELACPKAARELSGGVRGLTLACRVDRYLLVLRFNCAIRAGRIPERPERFDEGVDRLKAGRSRRPECDCARVRPPEPRVVSRRPSDAVVPPVAWTRFTIVGRVQLREVAMHGPISGTRAHDPSQASTSPFARYHRLRHVGPVVLQ